MAIDPSDGWSYYKEIDISDAGSVSADYQMKLTIYSGNGDDNTADGKIYCDTKCESFSDDIRFGTTNDPAAATQLKQWIESSDAASAVIWVKCPTDGSNTFYMFVGNSGASEESNGDDTFLFFDDFLGTSLDTNKWDVSAGITSTVSNSKLEVTTLDDHWAELYGFKAQDGSDNDWNPPDNSICMEARDYHWESSVSELTMALLIFSGSDWREPLSIGFSDGWTGNTGQKYVHIDANAHESGEGSLGISGTIDLKTTKDESNNVIHYWDGSNVLSASSSTVLPQFWITVNKLAGYAFGTISIDTIFIRKYTATEPSWSSFGAWTAIVAARVPKPTAAVGNPLIL